MPDIARLSINHVTTPRWPLPEAIAGYARAGVRGIGLWPTGVREHGVARIRRMLSEHELTATSYCCGNMFTATETSTLDRQRQRNRQLIEEAAELKVAALVCVSGGLPAGEKGLQDARQRTVDELADLLPFARDAGVTIGIEPIHPMKAADVSSMSTLSEANALCDLFGPGLGIIVDVYHVWWDPRLAEQIARAKGRIAGFHICDWLPTMEANIAGRGMMGDGVIDIASIRSWVEQTGYHGFHEVELVSKTWAERDPIDVVKLCVDRYRTQC